MTLLPESNEFRSLIALYGAKRRELKQPGNQVSCNCIDCTTPGQLLYERTNYINKRNAAKHARKERNREWRKDDVTSFWTQDEVLADVRRDLRLPENAAEYLPGACQGVWYEALPDVAASTSQGPQPMNTDQQEADKLCQIVQLQLVATGPAILQSLHYSHICIAQALQRA